MYLDKKQVARLLIHASIRNVFGGECPVANHVTVMSARQILHEYADAHGFTLDHDIRTYLKDKSLVREFESLWKTRYNFFKHADRDYDEEVNIRNINFLNEIETLFNLQKYQQMFGEMTGHMKVFMCFLAVMNPGKMKIETDDARVLLDAALKKTMGMSRRDMCEVFRYGLTTEPQTRAEIAKARELSFREPVPYPDEERDTIEVRRKRKG